MYVKKEATKEELDRWAGQAARIDQVIERIGGTIKARDLLGVNRGTLLKWRKGEARLPLDEIAILASAAGVTVDWIATGAGVAGHDDVVPLPRFDLGFDGALVQIEGAEWPVIPFWREALARQNADLGQTIAMVADGREMEPAIRQGAMLAIDRSRADMSLTGIYALSPRNRLLLMRSEMRLDGSLVLTSDAKPGEKQEVKADAIGKLKPIGMIMLVLATP